MGSESENQSQLFANEDLESTEAGIMAVEIKMKELRAEVAELDSSSSDAGLDKDKIKVLAQSLDELITDMGNLLKLLRLSDENLKQEFMQSTTMKNFRKAMIVNYDKLSQIKLGL